MTETLTSQIPPQLRREGGQFFVSVFVEVDGRQVEARAEYCATFLERVFEEAVFPALRAEEAGPAPSLVAACRRQIAQGLAQAAAGLMFTTNN